MTEHIEQASASDRYAAARKALSAWADADRDDRETEEAVVNALRALITPPTDNHVPQASASDRYAAARKALTELVQHEDSAIENIARGWGATKEAATLSPSETVRLFDVLRALITPPNVGESVEQIAANIERVYGGRLPQTTLLQMAVRAGIQSAHETWEPEVAQRPSQEQMLRWLGLRFGDAGRPTHIHIPFQNIEREEA